MDGFVHGFASIKEWLDWNGRSVLSSISLLFVIVDVITTASYLALDDVDLMRSKPVCEKTLDLGVARR
jgi:hypothetical protein